MCKFFILCSFYHVNSCLFFTLCLVGKKRKCFVWRAVLFNSFHFYRNELREWFQVWIEPEVYHTTRVVLILSWKKSRIFDSGWLKSIKNTNFNLISAVWGSFFFFCSRAGKWACADLDYNPHSLHQQRVMGSRQPLGLSFPWNHQRCLWKQNRLAAAFHEVAEGLLCV